MSRSTNSTSPLSFTRMTVETLVPYHLVPALTLLKSVATALSIAKGCTLVALVMSSGECTVGAGL